MVWMLCNTKFSLFSINTTDHVSWHISRSISFRRPTTELQQCARSRGDQPKGFAGLKPATRSLPMA